MILLCRCRRPLTLATFSNTLIVIALCCCHQHGGPCVRAVDPREILIAQRNAHTAFASSFGEAPESNLVGIPKASEECWLDAIEALSYLGQGLQDVHRHSSTDGTTNSPLKPAKSRKIGVDPATAFCSWMSPEHQKLLALELSGCHLNDLGRSLFLLETTDAKRESIASCTSGSPNSHLHLVTLENLPLCLKLLSDAGVTAYTHFFSYVNQLCTRLLQEVMVGHYYETTHQLAKSSQLAQERVYAVVQKHELLWDAWNEQQTQFARLQESFHEDLHGKQEQWLRHQSDLQKNYTNELESQQLKLQKLSEAISKTNQSMKPWLAVLESLVLVVAQNFAPAVSGLLSACGSILVIFLFTLPRRFLWIRKYLYGIVLMEVILECGLTHVDASIGFVFIGTKGYDNFAWISLLRKGAQLLEAMVFVAGLFASFPRRQQTDRSIPSSKHSEAPIMRRLELCEAELNYMLQEQMRIQRETPEPCVELPNFSQALASTKNPAPVPSLSPPRPIDSPTPSIRLDLSWNNEDIAHDDFFYDALMHERNCQPQPVQLGIRADSPWTGHATQTSERLSVARSRDLASPSLDQSSRPISRLQNWRVGNDAAGPLRNDRDNFVARAALMSPKSDKSSVSTEIDDPKKPAKGDGSGNHQARATRKRARVDFNDGRPAKRSPTKESQDGDV
jgi:hypothetical protein